MERRFGQLIPLCPFITEVALVPHCGVVNETGVPRIADRTPRQDVDAKGPTACLTFALVVETTTVSFFVCDFMFFVAADASHY